jgi:hypothetical protein
MEAHCKGKCTGRLIRFLETVHSQACVQVHSPLEFNQSILAAIGASVSKGGRCPCCSLCFHTLAHIPTQLMRRTSVGMKVLTLHHSFPFLRTREGRLSRCIGLPLSIGVLSLCYRYIPFIENGIALVCLCGGSWAHCRRLTEAVVAR